MNETPTTPAVPAVSPERRADLDIIQAHILAHRAMLGRTQAEHLDLLIAELVSLREEILAAPPASYLSAAEAAAELKITKGHMCYMARNGQVRAIRVGEAWIFDRLDIDELKSRQWKNAGPRGARAERPAPAPKPEPVKDPNDFFFGLTEE